MNNYLNSIKSPETFKLCQALVKILKAGGFKLSKFINFVNHLSGTLEPFLFHKVKKKFHYPSITSHVFFNTFKSKNLKVRSRGVKLKEDCPNTQRTVLGTVTVVLDSLTVAAPFTVNARVLLQDIWESKGNNRTKHRPNTSLVSLMIGVPDNCCFKTWQTPASYLLAQ